jgi:hypothetical protein|tara:strand:+ start:343 stop:684 length:342 start_codon:yes stop_codon:yes gene_type:complete
MSKQYETTYWTGLINYSNNRKNMKHKFKSLDFQDISKTHGPNATQAWVKMENGYEASIVKHGGSYGNEKGLYEMGIFGPKGSMSDPLGWDDTVKGHLTPEGVEIELKKLDSHL